MELGYKQEVTVGGLVILAIVLFILGTSWLGGRTIGGKTGDYWRVQFADAGGLKMSSAVRVSGVAVGRVEQIWLEAPGKVMVAISLDEHIVPKTDARAEVAAVGFVGDAAVDLEPGKASTVLPKDQVIVGTQAIGLTARAEALSHRADSVLMGLQQLANEQTAKELRATLVALQGTLGAAQQTMNLFANPNKGPTAALTETMASFRQLSARLDSTVANPALASALRNTDTLTANLAAVTARFDSTLAALNRGQGTIGKFATDSSLYYDIRATTQSLTSLIEDLRKHPGKLSPTVQVCLIPAAC